jgi:hypothetical protein
LRNRPRLQRSRSGRPKYARELAEKMSKRFVSVGVVLGSIASLFWASSASAQEWLKDRRYQEGPGYRTGDIELHPGIAGEIGYDSNWFLRSDKTGPTISNGAPAFPPEGGGIMRITPSLTISTLSAQRRDTSSGPSPQNIDFSAGLAATYLEFFGSELLRKQRNVSGAANARLTILPGHPWGGAVFGSFNRTIQPTVVGNPDLSFNRDDVGVGAEVAAQPNSGTLDWHLGYQFHATLFEQNQGAIFDNQTHQVETRGRWKFRPRTALLYDATLSFRSYKDSAANAPTQLHSSTPVRARLGLNGLITPRFSLLAMAGWASTFFDTNSGKNANVQQFDSVIAQVEAKFFPTSKGGEDLASASLLLSSIAVGYLRDYQFSYIGDFYGTDRGYAKVSYFFAGRMLVSLEGGVGAIEYPSIYFNSGAKASDPFTDIRADATLFAEYRVLQSVGINTTLRYTENFSSTQLPVAEKPALGQENLRYDMSWRRFEAYLGVRWFM